MRRACDCGKVDVLLRSHRLSSLHDREDWPRQNGLVVGWAVLWRRGCGGLSYARANEFYCGSRWTHSTGTRNHSSLKRTRHRYVGRIWMNLDHDARESAGVEKHFLSRARDAYHFSGDRNHQRDEFPMHIEMSYWKIEHVVTEIEREWSVCFQDEKTAGQRKNLSLSFFDMNV